MAKCECRSNLSGIGYIFLLSLSVCLKYVTIKSYKNKPNIFPTPTPTAPRGLPIALAEASAPLAPSPELEIWSLFVLPRAPIQSPGPPFCL